MKKILYSTTAFILCGIAQSQAACIPTPSCTSLGYTSTTSCTDGLKCPFGNYWNCSISEIRTEITEIKNIIEQQEQDNALKSCAIGHIFYSDMSCSVSMQTGKTPIGVVVYTDGQGHGQVIALKSIGSYIWGGKGVDISTITNSKNAQTASYELTSCINTAKIIAEAKGNKSEYPAAWAANEYKTEGTNAGDWCLPAAGIFTSYFKNQILINTGLTNAGGTPFTNALSAWTSTEMNSDYAWNSYLFMEYGLYSTGKNYSNEVRPVLEF